MDIFSDEIKKDAIEIKKLEKEMDILYKKKADLEKKLADKYKTEWTTVKFILDRISL